MMLNKKEKQIYDLIEQQLNNSKIGEYISDDYEEDNFKGFYNTKTKNTFRINTNNAENKAIEFDQYGYIEYSSLDEWKESLNKWIASEQIEIEEMEAEND